MQKKGVQHIRRSQFILTYGPGAIIESRNGPRLIPNFTHLGDIHPGDIFNEEEFKKYEIVDSRLRIAIKNIMKLQRVRIFSMPSNASLHKSSGTGIYATYLFPAWMICYGGRNGNGHKPILYRYSDYGCPLCKNSDDSTAVRFIAACTGGHLDDVDWDYAVHSGKNCNKNCKPHYYNWTAGGSSLANIIIECPECKCKNNMQNIYNMNFNCTGRRPENEDTVKELHSYTNVFIPDEKRNNNCSSKMKVIQRQSSSLHIPFAITLLTIPDFDDAISNILQKTEVYSSINTILTNPEKENPEKEYENNPGSFIKWIKNNPGISEDSGKTIEEYISKNGIKGFVDKFRRVYNEKREFPEFIYEEFNSLISGQRTSENKNFHMESGLEIPIKDVNLKIYPIKMLKTVTVQIGYTRMPVPNMGYHGPNNIGISFDNKEYWYPGFDGKGEGIFITFPEKKIPEIEKYKAYSEWLLEKNNHDSMKNNSDPIWGNIPREPLFVWLHTLSHAIIMEISLSSGYSSSSLRERVYINEERNNGGILIYTYSSGEDGSMGGLAESADDFGDILNRAYERIKYCSNDPLCSDVRKQKNSVNGAACYSCLMISETSCEHKNRWLDRHMLLGD